MCLQNYNTFSLKSRTGYLPFLKPTIFFLKFIWFISEYGRYVFGSRRTDTKMNRKKGATTVQ